MFFIICNDGVQLYGNELTWDQAQARVYEHGGIRSAGLRDDEDFRRELKGAAGYLYFRTAEQADSHRVGSNGWQALSHPPKVISETMAAFYPSEMLAPINRAGMEKMEAEIPVLEKRAAELSAAINAGTVDADSDAGNPLLVKIRDRVYHLKINIERIRIETDLLGSCAGKVVTVMLAMFEGRFLTSEAEKDTHQVMGQNPTGWIGMRPMEEGDS